MFTGTSVRPAYAGGDAAALRAAILKIPGVGMGSPGDAEWQKIGEMTLDVTRLTLAEGEFAGVELTFMGLNSQNLHNVLFRGCLGRGGRRGRLGDVVGFSTLPGSERVHDSATGT